jgi:transportin-1
LDTKFALILQECAKELRPDVKQSTFGVVGDCVKHSFDLIAPVLKTVVPVLIQSITPSKDGLVGVCNNAIWALGEIVVRVGGEMHPFALPFLEKCIPIVTKRNYEPNLLENVAITLGRFCNGCPDAIAVKLDIFVAGWCSILKKLRDDAEKESAFYGLVKVIQKNPNGAVKHFSHVCDAIASWEKTPEELNKLFANLLSSFKGVSGVAWPQFFKGLSDKTKERLQTRYQL